MLRIHIRKNYKHLDIKNLMQFNQERKIINYAVQPTSDINKFNDN